MPHRWAPGTTAILLVSHAVSRYLYGGLITIARAHGGTAQRPPEHGTVSIGRIAKLFVGRGYGFIRTTNDREIYFHRTDLRDGTSIHDLCIRDRVNFELLEDHVSGARALHVAPERRR
jgi:cold shock CspA family protein